MEELLFDKNKIDLTQITADVAGEAQLEKEKEVAAKIRHVINQAEWFKSKISKLKNDLRQTEEKFNKSIQKLQKIKEGDWNILSSIDPKQPVGSEKDEQANPTQ